MIWFYTPQDIVLADYPDLAEGNQDMANYHLQKDKLCNHPVQEFAEKYVLKMIERSK